MVVNSIATFGGLEEFTINLAIGLKRKGHEVSVLSTVWVPLDNQYLRSLHENNVKVIHLSKWQSIPVSDWPAKRKILSIAMWLSTPLIYLLSVMLVLFRKRPLDQSLASARNWQREHLINRFEPSERQPFVRLLLDWWRFRWHPDIIHIQGYTSDLLFVIDWAFSNKFPVVYEEHQTPDAQFDWWDDFKRSINKASVVIAVSEKSAQTLREVCGVTQPIEVVYYMVPDPVKSGWDVDARTGRNDGIIRITTPARLYITKGLTYLLEAIVLVKAVHPTVQFSVYGDGPLREELLTYSEKLGLDGNQIFVGVFTGREELSRIM